MEKLNEILDKVQNEVANAYGCVPNKEEMSIPEATQAINQWYIERVKELVDIDDLMDIVGMKTLTDSSFRGTMTEQCSRRIAKAIRSSILNKLEKGE